MLEVSPCFESESMLLEFVKTNYQNRKLVEAFTMVMNLLLDVDKVLATRRWSTIGICDAVDNEGNPYQSQALADLLSMAQRLNAAEHTSAPKANPTDEQALAHLRNQLRAVDCPESMLDRTAAALLKEAKAAGKNPLKLVVGGVMVDVSDGTPPNAPEQSKPSEDPDVATVFERIRDLMPENEARNLALRIVRDCRSMGCDIGKAVDGYLTIRSGLRGL